MTQTDLNHIILACPFIKGRILLEDFLKGEIGKDPGIFPKSYTRLILGFIGYIIFLQQIIHTYRDI